ncbi:uncharacterized protein LOC135843858 [Planococcus citri]|uniref:uncharacterized protein LOC135843858 n=1 Tax=Planococcus citri TaxID=170843 RepID=UPI0031F82BAF
MARDVLFILITMIFVLVPGQPPAPAPPPDLNAPKPIVQAAPECGSLPAKTLKDMPFKTGESVWWVGKLYVNPSAARAPPAPGATPAPGAPCGDNACSINSYNPDSCQAIKIQISRNEDGSICLKEAVFDKASNSASLIKNTWLPADSSKAIIKQMYGYYGKMDKSGTVNIIDPGPPEVKTAQSSDFVLIGAGEGKEWALFSSCCKSVVFVLYNDATICAKSTKTFDQAIVPLLQPLGIKPEDLKDVPTDFPIKLDNFIPPLPPATGAPPAATTASTTEASGDSGPPKETPLPTTPPTSPPSVTPSPPSPPKAEPPPPSAGPPPP